MRKKIISTKYLSYAEERCIALPFQGYKVKRQMDLYVFLSALHLRVVGHPNADWIGLHNDFNLYSCLGYHFWNAASYSRKPWVTTLELPCDDEVKLGLLARKQCKRVLCLSNWVLNTQRGIVKNSCHSNKILPKLDLLHPPQKIHRREEEIVTIKENEKIKFIFIGRDFFRKGGFECVKAFDKVIKSGYDAELTIVSKLDTKDWPHSAAQSQLDGALSLINEQADNIRLFREISHQKVMSLVAQSHVGLLPTYLDSYGYSVLEFFSYGIPAITTEVLAQQELNSTERGWFLSLPVQINQYEVKLFSRETLEQRESLSNLLTDALYKQMCSLLENREEIEKRRAPALRYVREFHDVSRYKNILENIYSSF